jgi:hypothetical protein
MIFRNTLLFGAACTVKSNAILFLPIMAFRNTLLMVIPMTLLFVYWVWFARHKAGRRQLEFLSGMAYVKNIWGTPYERLSDWAYGVQGRLSKYRCNEVLLSLMFYLFPLYFDIRVESIAIFGVITLLAPNIKYYLLCLV